VCYILGNSSSLLQCRLRDLEESGIATIGTNRLLRVIRVEYLLLADLRVLSEEMDRITSARPKLLILHDLAAKAQKHLKEIDHWTYFVREPFIPKRQQPYLGYEPEWQNGVLLRSGNTGTYALEIAALMGFTEIRLLGIDLRFDLPTSHFYGVNKYRGHRIKHTQRHLRRVVLAYAALQDRLKDMGVKVINESPIDGPLDDHIPKEKSPWLKNQ